MRTIRFIILVFAVCILSITQAVAYEYAKINKVFQTLSNDYTESLDFKTTSLSSLKLLNKFDDTLRIYSSDSKIFLYQNTLLIGEFQLPAQSENPTIWQNLLTDVLTTCAQRSYKIKQNIGQLEALVIESIVAKLDKFSRLDTEKQISSHLKYTYKDNILYLNPSFFALGTSEYLKKIISQHPKAEGVILDLRGNRGGQFNEAIKTADLFLDETLIAYSSDKSNHRKYYTATAGDTLNGKPLVILTNNYTASAAELVAASLSEQSRAILIGTKTYGKGSIQNTYSIDGKTLYITSAHFFSPSGKQINGLGIIPQICTGIDEDCTNPDKQYPEKELEQAIRFIKKKIS